jgi:nucleoid-associated protein YgaU
MVIYEANKDAIGDNPNMVRAGTVLKVPELPAALKRK